MSMPPGARSSTPTNPAAGPRKLMRAGAAALLGVAAALLVSCAGSGKSLIPPGNAGPLKHDFDLVAQAAENSRGSCGEVEAALHKTESDFERLPGTVDGGLRQRLRDGISKLREDAKSVCEQPAAQTTATTTAPKTTTSTQTTDTTPTNTQTTPTQSTTNTSTTNTTTTPGGGTPAHEGEGEPEPTKERRKESGGDAAPEGGK
jgi:hypothetical protein